MSDKMTFDRAVERLDEFLRSKTVHSVTSLNKFMLGLCNDQLWQTPEDYQDFANIGSNFEKHCLITKKTSFGRKQFEEAWETGFVVEDSLENAVKMLENKPKYVVNAYGTALVPLEEDDLPDFGTGESLEEENERLKLEVIELRKAMKAIKEMLNPWA